MVGGHRDPTQDSTKNCMSIDLRNGVSTPLSSMETERNDFSLCRVRNFLYAIGGTDLRQIRTTSCVKYNLLKDKWSDDLPELPKA